MDQNTENQKIPFLLAFDKKLREGKYPYHIEARIGLTIENFAMAKLAHVGVCHLNPADLTMVKYEIPLPEAYKIREVLSLSDYTPDLFIGYPSESINLENLVIDLLKGTGRELEKKVGGNIFDQLDDAQRKKLTSYFGLYTGIMVDKGLLVFSNTPKGVISKEICIENIKNHFFDSEPLTRNCEIYNMVCYPPAMEHIADKFVRFPGEKGVAPGTIICDETKYIRDKNLQHLFLDVAHSKETIDLTPTLDNFWKLDKQIFFSDVLPVERRGNSIAVLLNYERTGKLRDESKLSSFKYEAIFNKIHMQEESIGPEMCTRIIKNTATKILDKKYPGIVGREIKQERQLGVESDKRQEQTLDFLALPNKKNQHKIS